MEKINLSNRYNDNNYLQHIEDNKWKLVLEHADYYRIIGQKGSHEIDLNNLYAVDPSGGPFITVGSKLSDKKVTRITIENNDIILYLE